MTSPTPEQPGQDEAAQDEAAELGTSGKQPAGAIAGPTSGVPSSTSGLVRYWPESTLLQHVLLMLLAFVGIVLLIESLGGFQVSQLAQMAYYVPAVAGLTLLTGVNGQISLGHGALMAVGAYTTALLLMHVEGIPYSVVLLTSVLTTALVGVVVGAAASRLHGPYLAGATLALAVGLPGLTLYFEHELGGEQGLRVQPPQAPEWFGSAYFFVTGTDLTGSKYVTLVCWAAALVVLLLLSNLLKSRFGRMWRAVRDDEVAAQLAGINLGRNRVLAFVVSAACAGVGGSLLAIVVRLASPVGFTIVLSIFLLVAIVIGGLGSLTGAVLGSALLVFLIPFVTDTGLGAGLSSAQAANLAPLVFGIFLIVIMLAAPQGVVGTIRLKYLTRKAARQMAALQQQAAATGGAQRDGGAG
ncbi:MAG TPA: branched-chain amino acid ABC transporter permease [Mycobacteriales bacterium]|nr:branched-chain amino acid ABC transporter permease [Mycobacteriales bacterium]